MADIKFTGASTSPANTQQYVISKAGLQALAAATITKITGPDVIPGGKSIKVYTGAGNPTEIGVGNAISLPDNHNGQAKGTARLKVDGSNIDIPVQGLSTTDIGSSSAPWTNGYITNLYGTNAGSSSAPFTKGYFTNLYGTNVGSSSTPFTNGYITNLYGTNAGSSSTPFTNGYFTNLIVNGNNITALVPSSKGTTAQFWRGGGNNNPSWSNELEGSFVLTANKSAYLKIGAYGGNYGTTGTADLWYNGSNSDVGNYKATTLYCNKNFSATKVYNAVFNDYAEYRTTINLTPGHVVIDKDDGSLVCSSTRLQPGAQVISDTFGHSMGQTLKATTPIAVAGRVLVYTYQPRENYHAGMAVCSAPNGTVDIMTREEIRDYPDCIVGIVSEIPEYETWGSDNVKVDGRIWVRIK